MHCVAARCTRPARHGRVRAGNADADLMFIGEAPGANEDKQGLPFVGQAGKLLDKLLGEIGLERRDVFVATCSNAGLPATATPIRRDRVLPGLPVAAGRADRADRHLHARELLDQAAARRSDRDLTAPRSRRGAQIGPLAVRLLPLLHPAAALYTPSNLQTLRDDFAQIPGLLKLGPPTHPATQPPSHPPAQPEIVVENEAAPEVMASEQLGLF
jgi:uracil-DNA glycosylase